MTQGPDSPYLKIRCRCGALEGEVREPAWANRALCYCASCQAFPERLGRTDDVLDERGGSDILQTAPGSVHFTRGTEHLACLRITPKGPLRKESPAARREYNRRCAQPVPRRRFLPAPRRERMADARDREAPPCSMTFRSR